MPDSLPPEDEIARLRVENDQGAVLTDPGCRPSDQAASRLALSGIHPSRGAAFVTAGGEPLRPETYPPLRDIEGDYVTPAPDGRPWRKACGECLFRTNDPQGVGAGYADSLRYNNLHSEGLFYCVHRMDGDHNRVCASYAACREGDARNRNRYANRLIEAGLLKIGDAPGIETGTATTKGRGAEHESPPRREAPESLHTQTGREGGD